MASAQCLGNQKTNPLKEPENGDPYLENIEETEDFYQRIQADFDNAGLNIVSVERLHNHYLWATYKNERQHVVNQQTDLGSDVNLNERYLFHGTNANKELFIREELDNRLSKKGCFGPGLYFSDNPKKCAKYAEKGDEEAIILLCRVILGEAKVYPDKQQDRELKREPKHPNPNKRFYDSVQGCPLNYNEFVIYEKRRALIDCIITFTRKTEDQSTVEDLAQKLKSVKVDNSPKSTLPVTEDDSTDYDSSDSDEEKAKCKGMKMGEDDTSDTESDTEMSARDSNQARHSCSGGEEDSDNATDEEEDDDNTTDEEEDNAKPPNPSIQKPQQPPKPSVPKPSPSLRTQNLNDEKVQEKIKEFMDKTNETEKYIAQFYVVMENLDVESAVAVYNKPYTEYVFAPGEEEKIKELVSELESQFKLTSQLAAGIESMTPKDKEAAMEAMTPKDKETVISDLVSQFCVIVGLNNSLSNEKDTARKHLTTAKWETNLAVLDYFEELYGI